MFEAFHSIIEEMRLVYLHDQRPWMLGFSGGKDSTLLCQLLFEMLRTIPPAERTKKVYVVTSDTMVEIKSGLKAGDQVIPDIGSLEEGDAAQAAPRDENDSEGAA